MARGHRFHHADQLQILRKIGPLIARIIPAIIAFRQIVEALDLAGQKTAAQRAVGHETDAQILHQRQNLFLDRAFPKRIFALQGRNRMGGVGTANAVRARLRKAKKANFAFLDQPRHGTDRVLDRHIRIDAMLIIKIDHVDTETFQATLCRGADILRPTVCALGLTILNGETEFGGDHQPVAPSANGLSQQFLVLIGTIDLGGVEKGHAKFDGAVDSRETLLTVGGAIHRAANARHRHAAEAECRYREGVSERTRLHAKSSFLRARYPEISRFISGANRYNARMLGRAIRMKALSTSLTTCPRSSTAPTGKPSI